MKSLKSFNMRYIGIFSQVTEDHGDNYCCTKSNNLYAHAWPNVKRNSRISTVGLWWMNCGAMLERRTINDVFVL